MSDIILAGITDDPSAEVQWVRANAQRDVLDNPRSGTINQLAEAVGDLPLHVVICDPSISVTQTDLPVSGKKLQNALPFALEEQFPAEIESLHFAAGERDEHNVRPVVVIERRVLDSVIERLDSVDLSAQVVMALPESLAAADGQLLLVLIDDLALIDAADVPPVTFQGLPPDLVIQATLDHLELSESDVRQVQIYADSDAETRHADALAALRDGTPPTDVRSLAQGWFGFAARHVLARRCVNLLQGDYSVATNALGALRPWLAAAVLALAAGLITLIGAALETRSLNQRNAALDTQISDRVQRLTGSRLTGSQAEQQLAAVLGRSRSSGTSGGATTSGSTAGLDFIAAMQAVAAASERTPPQIDAISYDSGTVNIQLETDTDVALESLKDSIGSYAGLEASILRREGKGDAVSGRIQIRGSTP